VRLPLDMPTISERSPEQERAIMDGERAASSEAWASGWPADRSPSKSEMRAYDAGFVDGWKRRAMPKNS